jgi:dTDP-4-amino-4,6-dideoxygalactose transaminase
VPHLAAYRAYGGDRAYPVALLCSHSTINLPIHAALGEGDLQRIADDLAAEAKTLS